MKESDYTWNPKVRGSGIITCIPQSGICPNNCDDCFFQSGRSYLEPLDKNLPHLPPMKEMTKNRIVRIKMGMILMWKENWWKPLLVIIRCISSTQPFLISWRNLVHLLS